MLIVTSLTRITLFCGVISKTTQFTTFLASIPQYHDHKLVSVYGSSTIEVRNGFDSYLVCGFQCIRKPLCTAINYCTATDGSSICEFLATGICVSEYDRRILQSTPGCRFWDVLKNGSTCIMPTAQQCAIILPNCQPNGGPLCDTCTRTCREYFLRYNRKPYDLTGDFNSQIWTKGIWGPKIEAQCFSDCFMYLFKRCVDIATGQLSSYNFNSSFETISYSVERLTYSKLFIYIQGNGYTLAHSYYSVQSFQENGSMSLTFLSGLHDYDVLGLYGNPLVNAPFLNNSNVNPECGPFWLLPEGNLSCPGGERVRFWGSIKYTGSGWDTGFRCAKGNAQVLLGFIRLDL